MGRRRGRDGKGMHALVPQPRPPADTRELVGWWFYSLASGPFWGTGLSILGALITNQGKRLAIERHGSHLVDSRGGTCPVESNTCFLKPIDGSLSFGLDYESFVNACVTVSVILQLILSLLLSSFADYGNLRKTCLLVCNTLGCVACMLPIIFEASISQYWIGGVALILSNLMFNMAYVFFNSFLPLLAKYHTDVIAAQEEGASSEEQQALSQKVAHRTSAYGDVLNNLSSLVSLVLSSVLLATRPATEEDVLSRWVIAGCGLFSLCLSLGSCVLLRSRPGPDLPPDVGYVQLSLSRLKQTAMTYKKLPQTFFFLGAFSLLSDGQSTVWSAFNVFAVTELGLTVGQTMISYTCYALAAMVSDVAFLHCLEASCITGRQVMVATCFITGLLPLYGLVGLHHKVEIYVVLAVAGFVAAPFWAFGRSLYSQLVPADESAGFFALYQVTSNGTAWMGPLLIVIVQQATGSYRMAFSTLSIFFILGSLALCCVNFEIGAKDAREFRREGSVDDEEIAIFDEADEFARDSLEAILLSQRGEDEGGETLLHEPVSSSDEQDDDAGLVHLDLTSVDLGPMELPDSNPLTHFPHDHFLS